MRKSAQRKVVEVDAKQRWNWRFMEWARSIFTFPGVEGKSSSSSSNLILFFSVNMTAGSVGFRS
ncbi:hypothetical protein IEQ34_005062 [Dendrobium chrysotoxum]|uniref:Uncharacterized protein n=1 Tax=Dendrobium chrysotoxum TaxID=161865 RepID=A0AAV7HB81_DENCH|nr:hypothetical protein IEQ34_005062 [Dendrobium chrysotoxum]